MSNAEAFIELSDDGERMTCKMPADETVVEVRLVDGSVQLAYYSANNMEPGDWDFIAVDADGEPTLEAPSLIDRVAAWRPQP
ncbi:hypothetical protein [Mesorhizobium sp. ESP-6-2]|uniref:hypothetical protein n=1 Tax=Mesorhizobium sp. ESP-6-2 TaxID=2876625 RepID=UPI001CCA08DD|nr:hypothetical protein [Mesorhizobium sp. ESP-6-2]MBZ9807644.1 hypothetical protein [Mesorhizobium sp. ESP-6-2]